MLRLRDLWRSNQVPGDASASAGAWVQAVLEKTFAPGSEGARIVRIRMLGGTVPADRLVGTLNLPFVIVPLVNPGNNQHTHNENLRIGHYLQGIRAFTGGANLTFESHLQRARDQMSNSKAPLES